MAYFAAAAYGLRLRSYQLGVARAVCDSVVNKKGLTFVVIFPRQSGKNELQALIESYLLIIYRDWEAEIVKVSPTWKPQSLNAMRRLERVLNKNRILDRAWSKESGYIYRLSAARIFFLSASPTTNVVGATASTLLECDEAQDILISKWDKDINPMAASTNATRVFWGTSWTSQTLLAREMRAALAAENEDGVRRVFRVTADQVSAEVPSYRTFVKHEIARLGANHPMVRTQYGCEEIDAEAGMFPSERRSLMQGSHPPLAGPVPGEIYAFLLDLAGEDEAVADVGQTVGLSNPGRDATALTIVRIDLSLLDTLRAPRYQVVNRRLWTGVKHSTLFGQLLALVEAWNPARLVCDSTGVGAGLVSFLTKALGENRVIGFSFNSASKSKLGWDFLAVIESGRFQCHAGPAKGDAECAAGYEAQAAGQPAMAMQEIFWREVELCEMNALPGPARTLQWGVPDGRREAGSGVQVHDDLLISAALCSQLDGLTWGRTDSAVVQAADPLGEAKPSF